MAAADGRLLCKALLRRQCLSQLINQPTNINQHICRPEKGKSGSNGPTPKAIPQSTPRGLGSTWGSATPINQTPKGAPATVKTALQHMKQVLPAMLSYSNMNCQTLSSS